MKTTRLKKRLALVTGASGGLGAALALLLAEAGYAVALHCRSHPKKAERVQQQIRAQGGQAEIFSAELSQARASREMIAEMKKKLPGSLEVVINNSGTYVPKTLRAMSEKDWLQGFHSTATAACFVTQASLAWLRRSGRGRIINIGDSSADRATARDLALGYHIGKTGVWMLTRSFARAEAPFGVTVNMVSPGYLQNSVLVAETEKIPMGRLGTFNDIWAAVQFLISPEAAYITGSNIMVSGGWNLR